jgi:hypothetical protein
LQEQVITSFPSLARAVQRWVQESYFPNTFTMSEIRGIRLPAVLWQPGRKLSARANGVSKRVLFDTALILSGSAKKMALRTND